MGTGTLTAQDAAAIHQAAQQARTQPPPGSDEAEAASDALLANARAWNVGAHSDRKDTKWNRKHRRASVSIEKLTLLDRYVETQDIITASAAGLSERAYLIWHYVDVEGVSQIRLANVLGVSQMTISRAVCRAREELKYLVDTNAAKVFRAESHRSAYFAPHYRPPLASGVKEARQLMERAVEITTHIMPDDLEYVEVWKNGAPQPDYDKAGRIKEKPVGKRVSSLKTKVKYDRKVRRAIRQLKKVRAQTENNSAQPV